MCCGTSSCWCFGVGAGKGAGNHRIGDAPRSDVPSSSCSSAFSPPCHPLLGGAPPGTIQGAGRHCSFTFPSPHTVAQGRNLQEHLELAHSSTALFHFNTCTPPRGAPPPPVHSLKEGACSQLGSMSSALRGLGRRLLQHATARGQGAGGAHPGSRAALAAGGPAHPRGLSGGAPANGHKAHTGVVGLDFDPEAHANLSLLLRRVLRVRPPAPRAPARPLCPRAPPAPPRRTSPAARPRPGGGSRRAREGTLPGNLPGREEGAGR